MASGNDSVCSGGVDGGLDAVPVSGRLRDQRRSDGGQQLGGPQRYTLYPIVDDEVWGMYKKQQASFWTAEEVDFSKDREQWDRDLTDNERRFVKHILAFFAGTDSIVALNLLDNFSKDVTLLEAQIAYMYQAMIEGVHAEVYSIMIDTYITDPGEKQALFRDMGGVRSVLMKMEWAERWSLGGGARAAPFARRLVAFVIVEGLFFSGAFCAIYWLKQRNLLPGLTKSNEFIARDEGMHTEFGCLLYDKLPAADRLPEAEVQALVREAVAIEKTFINESIPCRLVGMNADMMATYIEHVADNLLRRLGAAPLYGAANPFPFMELIGMVGRSNFFEERVSLYQRADVLNEGRDLAYDEAF